MVSKLNRLQLAVRQVRARVHPVRLLAGSFFVFAAAFMLWLAFYAPSRSARLLAYGLEQADGQALMRLVSNQEVQQEGLTAGALTSLVRSRLHGFAKHASVEQLNEWNDPAIPGYRIVMIQLRCDEGAISVSAKLDRDGRASNLLFELMKDAWQHDYSLHKSSKIRDHYRGGLARDRSFLEGLGLKGFVVKPNEPALSFDELDRQLAVRKSILDYDRVSGI